MENIQEQQSQEKGGTDTEMWLCKSNNRWNAITIKARKAKEVHDVIKKHGKARKNTKKFSDAEVSVIQKAKNNKQTQLPHTQIIALIKI